MELDAVTPADPRPQVRRRAEPSALGPLRRQRGARGAGDRAQPRPLDGAAGARRGNRHDQDAQAALLRPRRTAHPLGTALDPAPPQALALGRAAGSRARATTGDTAPGLTPAHSAGPAPRLAPACPRPLLAPAPPGERRHTLRQPGIPPRQASIGVFGLGNSVAAMTSASHESRLRHVSSTVIDPPQRRR